MYSCGILIRILYFYGCELSLYLGYLACPPVLFSYWLYTLCFALYTVFEVLSIFSSYYFRPQLHGF
jgi:hypothetical protein